MRETLVGMLIRRSPTHHRAHHPRPYRPLSQCIIHETLRTDMSHGDYIPRPIVGKPVLL